MMRYAITKNAVILSLFAISTAAALAITNELTIGKVECNKQAALMASLNEVMPHDRHDNDLLADRITVSDPLLGRNGHHIYRARQDGEPNGAVLEATAPDGYGGNIALIVGVDMQGKVQGCAWCPRTMKHRGWATRSKPKIRMDLWFQWPVTGQSCRCRLGGEEGWWPVRQLYRRHHHSPRRGGSRAPRPAIFRRQPDGCL